MLTIDLRPFSCPQQFVQFKLGLRRLGSQDNVVEFLLPLSEDAGDIKRYLIKHAYDYRIVAKETHMHLTVEHHPSV